MVGLVSTRSMALVLLVVCTFLALVLAQADKPFVLDEVDFPVLAQAISETGLPYHYRGETSVSALGLWHPPLYAYSLAAFVKIFGFDEITVRAFGLSCALVTAYLSVLIYFRLFPESDAARGRVVPLFLVLFLLHPYVIANSTVPDIDSTVLPLTVVLFVYWLVRLPSYMEGENTVYSGVLGLSLLFALNLWAKLTTPLALLPLAFSVLVARGWPFKSAALLTFGFGAVGFAIFVLTYWLYCTLLELPFDFVFNFLLFSFSKNANSDGMFAGILYHLEYSKQFVYWLGVPLLIVVIMTTTRLLLKRGKSEGERVLFVLVMFSVCVTLFYLALTGAFGGFFKYPYPVFPFLVIGATYYIHSYLHRTSDGFRPIRIAVDERAFLINPSVFVWLTLVVASVIFGYYQISRGGDFELLQARAASFVSIVVVASVAVAAATLLLFLEHPLIRRYVVSGMLGVVVAHQFAVSRGQALADYPTKYHYGQHGFMETVSYLKSKVNQNEPIWAMKDIGHYVTGKYVENYGHILGSAVAVEDAISRVVERYGVRYFVVTSRVGQDRVDAYPELRRALGACCVVEQQIGDFLVYRKRSVHE